MIIYNGKLFADDRALEKYQNDNEFKPKFLCGKISLHLSDSILSPVKSMDFIPLCPNETFELPPIFSYPISSQMTRVLFPPDAGSERQQANQLNYNSFIHVMADMIQKYAPKILVQQEDIP